jgi:sulfur carrier protein
MKSVEACIFANGKPAPVSLPCTVAEFLEKSGWKATQVVVECNGSVLPRSRVTHTPLSDGDRLEIIVPVAGG